MLLKKIISYYIISNTMENINTDNSEAPNLTFYQKYKETLKKCNKEYQQRHPDRVKQFLKNWRDNNPEKVKEYSRKCQYNKYHTDPEFKEKKKQQALARYYAKKNMQQSGETTTV